MTSTDTTSFLALQSKHFWVVLIETCWTSERTCAAVERGQLSEMSYQSIKTESIFYASVLFCPGIPPRLPACLSSNTPSCTRLFGAPVLLGHATDETPRYINFTGHHAWGSCSWCEQSALFVDPELVTGTSHHRPEFARAVNTNIPVCPVVKGAIDMQNTQDGW